MQNHMYVFPARKFQIQTPGSTTFTCISWMLNKGYVAVGGSDGALRVMLLNLDQDKSNPPSSLNPWLSSQQLEGHSSSVRVLSWNEVYQKLASTDDSGVIIVWMTHGPDESWFEEMVNNRQKSTVSSLKWSNDGMKIAIAYEDGQVIVGSVDGNRLWNKDIGGSLTKIAWNTDDTLLLLGFSDGEVHAYSQSGDFVSKVKMLCVENMEIETALSNLKKDVIVSMEWYVPPHSCKITINISTQQQQSFLQNKNAYNTTGDESSFNNITSRIKVPEGRPLFLVAYQNGNIQLMCTENISKGVSIVRLPSTLIIMAQWSPDGSMFAVAGLQLDLPETERNVLHFISAYGERLQSIRLAPGHFAGIAWESSGHRLGALIDTNIYLVVIKFPYRWTYCGQTLVFAYKTLDSLQEVLIFYETKMEVKTKRFVQNLCALKSYGDYCVTIFRTEELRGAYTMQLCDSIGTPVDSHTTNVQCSLVAMNSNTVIVASTDSFIVWHYSVPRQDNTNISTNFQKVGGTNVPSEQNDKIHYIDEHRTEQQKQQSNNGITTDPICAVSASTDFFLIARESGTIYRFSLPDIQLQITFKSNIPAPKLMSINCDGSRLAIIGKYNILRLIDLPKINIFMPVLTFERREVWSVEWDNDKNDLLALMEKQRLVIIRGTETDEPIPHIGRICQFKNLIVRLVLLDDIFKDPDRVNRHSFDEIEIKILKTIKSTLESDKIQEAIALIEKGNHPKLWNILATDALRRLDLRTAEHAFVKLQDYGGILFLKRLQNIHSDALKRAEVSIFLGDLENAEKIYFEHDRRDLAIDMLKKMHDWFRIQQILQTSTGPGDDALAQQTWKHVGDYFAERQKWQSAARYYEQSRSYSELARCYLMMADFSRMEALGQDLPKDHEVLNQLAETFTSYGLCEQAVDCYLKSNRISDAFETCIKLNKWDRAAELSDRYHLANVENLLNQYAHQIVGNKTKNLAIAQLYSKAAKYLQAAKIVYEVANSEHQKQAPPLRLKKLYVMGALLIEEYYEQNRQKIAKRKEESGGTSNTSLLALDGLLSSDHNLSIDEIRMIDTSWRGAEAYHFFMLSHSHLYKSDYVSAVKTALTLTNYEDLLDPMEVYSLLALTSYLAEYYGVCSKAFMKLEAMQNISKEEQEVYSSLAMQIFLKNEPKDLSVNYVECPNCDAKIEDHSIVCPNLKCNNRLPICVATGRPIFETQFWICTRCKHRAYQKEINIYNNCPLCHNDFNKK